MTSLRQKVFIYLKNNPNVKREDLKRKFKNESWNSVRTYKNQYFKIMQNDISSDISGHDKHSSKNPIDEDLIGMDDIELMRHKARKMIMKSDDPRWVQQLFALNKEAGKISVEYDRELEWSNLAKNMTMEDLVGKVAMKGSISKNISRRLERLDDSSPLDNT